MARGTPQGARQKSVGNIGGGPAERPRRRTISCPAPVTRARASARFLPLTIAVFSLIAGACRDATTVDAGERRTIADSLQKLVIQAYDFSRPDAPTRLLSLYTDSGRVISAAAGRITTTRAALATDIAGFWQRVGQNMRDPQFKLGSAYVDIITRDAAVMTFTYSIPHHTPAGVAHTVSGAWTTFWRNANGRWQIVQEHLSDTPESTAPGPTPPDTGHAMPGMDMPGMTMPPQPPSTNPSAKPPAR